MRFPLEGGTKKYRLDRAVRVEEDREYAQRLARERAAEAARETYVERVEVRGTEFQVGWDNGYREYTIYFPKSGSDLRVGRDRARVEKLFTAARGLAVTAQSEGELVEKLGQLIARTEPEDAEADAAMEAVHAKRAADVARERETEASRQAASERAKYRLTHGEPGNDEPTLDLP